MLDKIILDTPFKPAYYLMGATQKWGSLLYTPRQLGVRERFDVEPDGTVSESTMPYYSIPSSHASMGVKVFPHGRGKHNPFPCVSINASPAKIIQGHNVYGSDNIELGVFSMLKVLSDTCPVLFDKLDFLNADVSQFDFNYFSRFSDNLMPQELLNFLSNISEGQIKSNYKEYATTAYFNKTSELRMLRIYLKLEELEHSIKDIKKDSRFSFEERQRRINIIEEQKEFASNILRFEVVNKTRYLRKKYNTKKLVDFINKEQEYKMKGHSLAREFFDDAFSPILKRIRNKTMRIDTDDEILERLRANNKSANSAFATYLMIKNKGWIYSRKRMDRNTHYRHVKILQQIGVSKPMLQNINFADDGNVLPLYKVITLDFSNQFPDDWQEPTLESLGLDSFANRIYENKPILRVV